MKVNQAFLDKAISLLPRVSETKVTVSKTTDIEKKGDKISIKTVCDYNKTELSKGDKVILDFGNHRVGYLTLKFNSVGSHADAPVILKIQFAEHPAELFESPENYHGWICTGWIQQEQIFVDVVPSVMKLQRRYAFRYVKIEVVDISSKFNLVIEDAFCTAVSSADDNVLEKYENKDSKLVKLDKIACKTLHDCMQTVFEDGPKRDRRLWIGDLRLQALANYQTYKNNDMVKACLYLFAALPMENGKVGACLFLEPKPEVDDTSMFDYSLFFISILLDYYKETKDLQTLKELYETALRQIDIAKQSVGENGLVKDSDELGWCFIDWNLSLNKQAAAQGVLLYAVNSAIEICRILGNKDKETELLNDRNNYIKAAKKYLWDNEKQLFISGAEKQISWASQVWMILGGAVADNVASKILNRLKFNKEAVKMVTPYMYHNYIDALVSIGEKDEALFALKDYWGAMADLGADTFFELYNPDNPNESPYGGTIVNSYCHAWSCAPAYFLRKYYK